MNYGLKVFIRPRLPWADENPGRWEVWEDVRCGVCCAEVVDEMTRETSLGPSLSEQRVRPMTKARNAGFHRNQPKCGSFLPRSREEREEDKRRILTFAVFAASR